LLARLMAKGTMHEEASRRITTYLLPGTKASTTHYLQNDTHGTETGKLWVLVEKKA
jgi:hypothetical protein